MNRCSTLNRILAISAISLLFLATPSLTKDDEMEVLHMVVGKAPTEVAFDQDFPIRKVSSENQCEIKQVAIKMNKLERDEPKTWNKFNSDKWSAKVDTKKDSSVEDKASEMMIYEDI